MSNEWFEKGELPPVGLIVRVHIPSCSCEYVEAMHGKDAKILMHRISSTGHPVAVFCIIDDDGFNSYHALTSNDNFRPIKSDREKAIEAARDVLRLDEIPWADRFGRLYDAGLLRLREDK